MIQHILQNRLHGDNSAWTVKVRFSSTGRAGEFAIDQVFDDGFLGTPIGRTQTGLIWVRYGALDYIRILEEGDV